MCIKCMELLSFDSIGGGEKKIKEGMGRSTAGGNVNGEMDESVKE